MNKFPSVTIGIPAYNEAENIGSLITSILNQDFHNFNLVKIIISSDNSSDDTVKISKSFDENIIDVFDNKTRKGVAFRQNQIIQSSNTDVLILLNADIKIKQKDFLWRMIMPIVSSDADLTSCNLAALEPRTFIGKIMVFSFSLGNRVFVEMRGGHNLYTCHGAVRAFSKRFYKDLEFEESVGEDAYSYLDCLAKGLTYRYVANATAFIRWPENAEDQYHQSLRFHQSKKILSKKFGEKLVHKEYKIPKQKVLISVIKFYFFHPVHALIYTLFYFYTKLSSLFNKHDNTWKVSISSKKL